MSSNLDIYKADLKRLQTESSALFDDLAKNKDKASIFHSGYQNWYTEAQQVIRQIIPSRLEEFDTLYSESKRKKIDASSFAIKDWMLGMRSTINNFTGQKYYDDHTAALMRFQSQISILLAAIKRFESSLFDIKQLVQADLFDSEIGTARELNKKGFARGAGAIAGVVLEAHLRQVCTNHAIKTTKKNPSINDYNQILKDNEVIEVKDWRFIQHLADLRNLCDHDKDKTPSTDEIADLLDGVEKVSKTVY